MDILRKQCLALRVAIHRSARWLLGSAVALALIACGGGGVDVVGDASGCSSTTSYDSYGYSPSTFDGAIDEPVDMVLNAHVLSGCKLSHKLEGDLPPGVHFSSRSGRISGTPTAGGIYQVTVRPNAASGHVSTSAILHIEPIGRPTAALAPERLEAPSGFDIRMWSQLAVGTGPNRARLWIGGYRADTGRYEFFVSDNDGALWKSDHAGGLIEPRGDTLSQNQFSIGASGAEAYVLDTGGTLAFHPMPSVLYRFDGTAWSLRNETLPFRALAGASLYVGSHGRLAVAWSSGKRLKLWTSRNGGLDWTERAVSAGISERGTKICLGAVGNDWHAVADVNGFWVHVRLNEGKTHWQEQPWTWQSYMTPEATCASDGARFTLTGLSNDRDREVLAVSDIVAGDEIPAFRRLAPLPDLTSATPVFSSIAASKQHLFGLVADPNGVASYELWKLR